MDKLTEEKIYQAIKHSFNPGKTRLVNFENQAKAVLKILKVEAIGLSETDKVNDSKL